MAIKNETERVVVTVKLEIDADGVDRLAVDYGSNMAEYLSAVLSADITVINVLKIEEFGE